VDRHINSRGEPDCDCEACQNEKRVFEPIESHDGRWNAETWIFHLRTPCARKTYECNGCGEIIKVGQRHVKYVTANVEGPGMETWRCHGECYLSDIPMFIGDRPSWRWEGPGMKKCQRCGRYTDPEKLAKDDEMGQGEFCNARWKDKDGFYCLEKALEGRVHGVICPYTEKDVKKDCCQLVCTKSKSPKALKGTCQDFQPSKALRKKFGI
jgi:hypothetical protein